MIKTIVAASLCLFLLNARAAEFEEQDLVVNGSFEDGHGMSGQTSAWTTFDEIPGWHKDETMSEPIEVQYLDAGGVFASQGRALVELDVAHNGGLFQDIPVIAGQHYRLSFDYAPRTTDTSSNSMEVLLDGVVLEALSAESKGWKSYQYELTADAASLRLSFRGTGTSDGFGALIDNVRLIQLAYDFNSGNLIENGSFEDGHEVAEGQYGLFTELGQWKADANSIPVDFEVQGQYPGIIFAKDGIRKIELDAAKNSSITQTVAVESEADYVLNIGYTPRNVALGSSNNVELYVDGVLVSTLYHDVVEWRNYPFNVHANGSTLKIELKAAGLSDGFGGLIDDLSLLKDGTGQNLLQNPSFEITPDFDAAGYALFPHIEGWDSGTFDTMTVPFEIQMGGVPNVWGAREGSAKLELDSNANTIMGVDVPVVDGKTYLLSFSYTPRIEGDPSTNEAKVLWNGVEIADLNGSVRGWTDHRFLLTGQGETSRLQFAGAGTSDGYGALIDDVVLRELRPSGVPLANFSFDVQDGQMLLDASSSSDDMGITLYRWRLGGPTSVESTSPLMSFPLNGEGEYEITLTVQDADGNTAYHYKKILVDESGFPTEIGTSDGSFGNDMQNPAPIALGIIDNDEPFTGQSVNFDASGSFSLNSAIVAYTWHFGDGIDVNTTSPFVSHAYTSAGDKHVILVVTDALGHMSSAALPTITVRETIGPVAVLAASTLTGRAPLSVSFTGASSLPIGDISEYAFSYGDGGEDITDQPATEHVYTVPGTYEVTLQVTESGNPERIDATTVTLTVLPQDNLPHADARSSVAAGKAPVEIFFDAGLSSDDKGIASYSWNFGDGSPAVTGPNAKFTQYRYTTPGNYNAVLTVTDTAGQTAEATLPMQITPAPIHLANFIIRNDHGAAPETITLDATTPDTAGYIFSYEWEVDGEITAQRQPILHKTIPAAGEHTVTLRVSSGDGVVHSTTQTFTTAEMRADVDFFYAANSPVAASTVQFDAGAGAIGTSYSWDFGDGSEDTQTIPLSNHVYTRPGIYDVKLKVEGIGETSKTIVVAPNQAPLPELTMSLLAGTAPVDVQFTGNGTVDDEGVSAFKLDFGDGSPSLLTQVVSPSLTPIKRKVISQSISRRRIAKAKPLSSRAKSASLPSAAHRSLISPWMSRQVMLP